MIGEEDLFYEREGILMMNAVTWCVFFLELLCAIHTPKIITEKISNNQGALVRIVAEVLDVRGKWNIERKTHSMKKVPPRRKPPHKAITKGTLIHPHKSFFSVSSPIPKLDFIASTASTASARPRSGFFADKFYRF
jgi:hypothetical protein